MQDIRTALVQAKGPWYPKPDDGPGFYAIFLKASATLPLISVPDDGLLYVGKTLSGVYSRDHVAPRSGHSGDCTVRRSLGALLRHDLDLDPQPRSLDGNVRTACTNFRFSAAAETRLSNWMMGALYLSRVPHDGDVDAVETVLIEGLRPPLNLKGWANPQAGRIKWLRKQCAYDAAIRYAEDMRAA